MSKYFKDITDISFKSEILNSKLPVLIDFWAEWCNPCKIILPILKKVSIKYKKKIKMFKINIDNNNIIPNKYNIKSIPTLIIIRNGVLIDEKIGLLSFNQLISFIEKIYLNIYILNEKNIHPLYRKVLFYDVLSNNKFLINSTIKTDKFVNYKNKRYPFVKIEISSKSHPFYTGKQKILDIEGRVDKFNKKFRIL